MIARLDGERVDLVAGRKLHRKDSLGKRLPSWIFNAVTSFVTGLKLKDHNCGLKVGRRLVFEQLPLYGEMHRFLAAISHGKGFVVIEQPVQHRARQHGASKFGVERFARGALDLLTVVMLTRYDHRPGHLFGGIGLALGTLGMALLVYLSSLWLFFDQAIGNRPLLLLGALLVLLSAQLISLGVLAELLMSRETSPDSILRRVKEATP
jgi:dolichol-phosphate mannosyltransferase